MGVGNELGQKLGHRQVGIPVVNIEGGDGQPHNRTEDVTAYELKGTALNEAQREAKEVVDGVGMLAQLVDVLHVVALVDYEVEGLLREGLHHFDEARLDAAVRAVDVDEDAAQVQEAAEVVERVHAHDGGHHVGQDVERVLLGGAEHEAEGAATRLGHL